jgi:hypothetical protein
MVMKAKPMGMLSMVPAGHLNRLPRSTRWALKTPPHGYLVARTRKFTLLDDAVRRFGGAAVTGGIGEVGRRQRLVGVRGPSGKRRLLFGASESPAEAKQESIGAKRKEFVKKFVSEQWILSCKSLGRPLVYHL